MTEVTMNMFIWRDLKKKKKEEYRPKYMCQSLKYGKVLKGTAAIRCYTVYALYWLISY